MQIGFLDTIIWVGQYSISMGSGMLEPIVDIAPVSIPEINIDFAHA